MATSIADFGTLVNDAIGASQPVPSGFSANDFRIMAAAGWRFVPPGEAVDGGLRMLESAPAPAPVTVAPLPMTPVAIVAPRETAVGIELAMPVLHVAPVSRIDMSIGSPVIKSVPIVTPQLAVTPAPSPLPTPSESWLDRAARTVSEITAGFDSGKEQGKRLADQINSLPGAVAREITETRSDVQQAANLNKILPLAVGAIGVFMGFPLIGIGAAIYLYTRD